MPRRAITEERGEEKRSLLLGLLLFVACVQFGGAEGRDEMKSEIPSAHGTATTCRGREKRALPKGVEGGGTFLDNANSQPIGTMFFSHFQLSFFLISSWEMSVLHVFFIPPPLFFFSTLGLVVLPHSTHALHRRHPRYLLRPPPSSSSVSFLFFAPHPTFRESWSRVNEGT